MEKKITDPIDIKKPIITSKCACSVCERHQAYLNGLKK